MLQSRRTPEVQADYLVLEVATLENLMANFNVLIAQRYRAAIMLDVNQYAQMIDQTEGKATVRPSLRAVAVTTLLRT